jgi:tetratricopeptide (TPR) repeat protein
MRLPVLMFVGSAFLVLAGLIPAWRAVADDGELCVKGAGDEQIAACTRAINSGQWRDSHLAWAYNNRCKAYNDMGNHDRAIADCNKALQLDPNFGAVYYNRGIAYDGKGDRDHAIADYTEAIWLDAKFALAYYHRGLAKRAKGDSAGGDADIAKAKQLDPKAGQ